MTDDLSALDNLRPEVRDAVESVDDDFDFVSATEIVLSFADWKILRAELLRLAALERQAKEGITDTVVEHACRALCDHFYWNADEPVTYSGRREKCRNIDGSLVPQWSMHALNARVILESAAMALQHTHRNRQNDRKEIQSDASHPR